MADDVFKKADDAFDKFAKCAHNYPMLKSVGLACGTEQKAFDKAHAAASAVIKEREQAQEIDDNGRAYDILAPKM